MDLASKKNAADVPPPPEGSAERRSSNNDTSCDSIDQDGDGYCAASTCTDGSDPDDCDDTLRTGNPEARARPPGTE